MQDILTASIILCMIAMVPADGLYNFRMDEHLVDEGWRIPAMFRSPVTNPSFVAFASQAEIRTVICPVVQTFLLFESGISLPLNYHHSIGISCIGQGSKAIDRTEIVSGIPVRVGKSVSNANAVFNASYGFHLQERVGAGVNIGLATQQTVDGSSVAPTVDCGIHYRRGEAVAGLAMRSIAPLKSADSTVFAPRATITLSAPLLHGVVIPQAQISVNDLAGGQKHLDLSALGQITMNISGVGSFSAVAGYIPQKTAYGGINVQIELQKLFNNRSLRVAWQYLTNKQDRAPLNSFVFSMGIGEPRLSAQMLYYRALQAFEQYRYWDALLLFCAITRDFPSFSDNERVCFYTGECYRLMRMFAQARQTYQEGLSVPGYKEGHHLYRFGLLRIARDIKSTVETERRFHEFYRKSPPDSLLAHGHYLYGQVLLQAGKIDSAYRVLQHIEDEHQLYPFARFSMAIAKIKQYRYRQAEELLSQTRLHCGQDLMTHKLLYDKSAVRLGMVYLEHDSLFDMAEQRALQICSQVEPTSPEYLNALLVRAWAAHRIGKNESSLDASYILAKVAKAPPLDRVEAMLLVSAALWRNPVSAGAVLESARQELDRLLVMFTFKPDSRDYSSAVEKISDSLAGTASVLAQVLQRPPMPSVKREIAACRKKYVRDSTQYAGLTTHQHQLDQMRKDKQRAMWLREEFDYAHAKISSLEYENIVDH